MTERGSCPECGSLFPADGGEHCCRNAGRVCGLCKAFLEAPGSRHGHVCGQPNTNPVKVFLGTAKAATKPEPENCRGWVTVGADVAPCVLRAGHEGRCVSGRRCQGRAGARRCVMGTGHEGPCRDLPGVVAVLPLAELDESDQPGRVEYRAAPVQLRVVAAAIQLPSGAVLSMPPPARHHSIIHAERPSCGSRGQGFLLSDGTFADRKRAAEVAIAAGQLLERAPTAGHWKHGLFSEDVW